MKHTKGPWKQALDYNGEPQSIVETEGGSLVAISQWNPNHVSDWREVVANARLIAAAPDMYEAIKMFLELGAGSEAELPFSLWQPVIDMRAALAKAAPVEDRKESDEPQRI